MIDHREAILALFVIAALIVGTAGYETIQADRSADVSVTNDADAYLALEPTGNTIQNGSTGSVLVITNQFGSEVDLSVQDLTTSGNITSQGLTNTTLDSGESAEFGVTCESSEDGTLTVDLAASGDGISFRTSETVTVSCT